MRKLKLVSSIVLVAIAACSESATSPVDGTVNTVTSRALAKKVRPVPTARAMRLSSGKTIVEVSTGTFASLDANNNLIPGIPAEGVLNHVHIKFCKSSYKDFDLHQFSANFVYKTGMDDDEKDFEPDSPLDSDDKDHKQVNWDRSATKTTLQGDGDVSLPFTGLIPGTSVEVHTGVRWVDGKNYEDKFCVPVENAPDLAITQTRGPGSTTVGVSTTFQALVEIPVGSLVAVAGRCAVYADNVLVGYSDSFIASTQTSVWCTKALTFATTGTKVVRFELSDLNPGDSDPSNNSGSRSIVVGSVSGGFDPSVTVVTSRPTMLEKVDTIAFKDSACSLTANSCTSQFPPQTLIRWDQSSTFNAVYSRLFSGPVRLILKQYVTTISPTGVRSTHLLHSFDRTFTNACPTTVNAGSPVAYSVSFCSRTATGQTELVYLTRSRGNTDTGPETGTFDSYGDEMTYDITVINAGYSYHLDRSVTSPNFTLPINTFITPVQAGGYTDCNIAAPPGQRTCHFGSSIQYKREGSGDITVQVTPQPFTTP